ncbi:MAG: hypothetical protein ACK4OM_07945 [Alphaproteobacteria bacterium]
MLKLNQEIVQAIDYNMLNKVKKIILENKNIDVEHYAKIALLQGKLRLARLIIIWSIKDS